MGFIDSLIDAGASAITAIPQAIFGHYENNRNMHFQSDEAKAQRDWQSSENQKNRQWQEDMYNLYNSPSAMMRQYKEGHLNPFLMASQNNIGNGMSATPSSGSGASAAGSSPPALPSHSGTYLQSLGVNAEIANAHARTIQQKWETYQYIREHVGRDAAKRWLANNPDMMETDSPENDPWMKQYKRAEVRENIENDSREWEFSLRKLYGIKQAELEMNFVNEKTNDLVSQIDKRSWDIKEIRKTLKLIDEKIRTEKSVQSRNYSESGLASAKAATENQTRQYVVSQFLYRTGILNHASQMDNAIFESKESLRGWLSSREAKEAFAKAARNHGLWNADAVRSSLLEFLGSVNVGTNISPQSTGHVTTEYW